MFGSPLAILWVVCSMFYLLASFLRRVELIPDPLIFKHFYQPSVTETIRCSTQSVIELLAVSRLRLTIWEWNQEILFTVVLFLLYNCTVAAITFIRFHINISIYRELCQPCQFDQFLYRIFSLFSPLSTPNSRFFISSFCKLLVRFDRPNVSFQKILNHSWKRF